MIRTIFIFFLCVVSTVSCFAQNEWESAVPAGLGWKTEPRLTTYSSTLSNLRTSNLTSETYENKRNNKVGYLSACLTQELKLSMPCEIEFTAKNTNNYVTGPKYHVTHTKKKIKAGRVIANIAQTILFFPVGIGSWWWNPTRETVRYGYTDDLPSQVYWGYTIQVKTINGMIATFSKRFCHSNGSNVDEWNSDTSKWQSSYGSGTECIKLVYELDKTLKLYSNNILVKTFSNIETITYLGLDVGCNAKLEVSDFSIRQMTKYGVARLMLDEVTLLMQQENWYNASKLLTEIMDNVGYSDYKTYYLRGYCQMALHNIRTAIDDLTKAINSPLSSQSERESAYYLRGYCKAQIEDIECVNDMRMAGNDGKTWLKEMQLEDYYPNPSGENESPKSSKVNNRPKKALNTVKKPPLNK